MGSGSGVGEGSGIGSSSGNAGGIIGARTRMGRVAGARLLAELDIRHANTARHIL
jgi:hypothetical protein